MTFDITKERRAKRNGTIFLRTASSNTKGKIWFNVSSKLDAHSETACVSQANKYASLYACTSTGLTDGIVTGGVGIVHTFLLETYLGRKYVLTECI